MTSASVTLPRFSFGDTPAMANSGLANVIARRQVATCGALEIIEREGQVMPFEGGLEVVLDGCGRPGCIIRTTRVEIRRFDEIDEEFAGKEACVDLSEWRAVHEAYFNRLGCFAPDMKLVCQHFDVVEVPAREVPR